jgi:AGZA family xanthine/uracil permease-like MFS transporter
MTTRYAWAQRGDINAFFGLILDNVAVMIFLLTLITSAKPATDGHFSRDFVFTQMIPGTALGVVAGDLVYTWLAFRLARRGGRNDVTAMPLGLDTPSTIAIATLILLPSLKFGLEQHGYDHGQAMVFAWHVGAVLLVMIGICKSIVAPLGTAMRRWVPRAGLLGSLAGIALALIALVPLWQNIAAAPLIGLVSLVVILVALVAHHPLPGRIPGALAAVLLGAVLYWSFHLLGPGLRVTLVPPPAHQSTAAWRLPEFFPEFARNWPWWQRVFVHAVAQLPVMLPFALATIVGGIDCTESAAAAGDEYDTRGILWTEGLASVLAGLFGGVIQTTPYIGQPAYKAMGGRAAYTLATALFIGLAGGLGWFAQLFEWLPEAACFPILVFVGLEIGAQSFRATPARHYAALALAMLPALAYLATIPLDIALGPERQPMPSAAAMILALRCLASGFIVTSLLWASTLAAVLDRQMFRAAAYLGVAAVCSLVGIIHSPLAPAVIGWPWDVYARMLETPEMQAPGMLCQSPYHWAGGYLLAAVVVMFIAWTSPGKHPAPNTSAR